MKRHADKSAPLGGALWEGAGKCFINKGTNGRWRDVLPPADCAAYDARAREECARWLANGAV
jgi:aryl sulfotransferase